LTFHPQYSPLSPPEIQFNAVDLRDGDKPASGGVHGPYRQPFIDPLESVYLGRPLTFRLLPIAVLSLLSYFARLERIQIAVAPHLPPNRVVADAQGREGPTQQDITDFNSHPRIHIPNSPANVTSDRMTSDFFDHYWSWMISPYDERSSLFISDSPRYIPGYLSGHWRGTAVVRSNARSLGDVLTSIHVRCPTAQAIGAG
jgi:hypothetical protein